MEVGNLNGKGIQNFNGYGIARWCLIFDGKEAGEFDR